MDFVALHTKITENWGGPDLTIAPFLDSYSCLSLVRALDRYEAFQPEVENRSDNYKFIYPRLHFIEAALISYAMIQIHAVMAVIGVLGILFTLNEEEEALKFTKRQVVKIASSVAGGAVACVGLFSPDRAKELVARVELVIAGYISCESDGARWWRQYRDAYRELSPVTDRIDRHRTSEMGIIEQLLDGRV